jgi:hypothetical protein
MSLYTYYRDADLETIKNGWVSHHETNVKARARKIKELVDAYVIATKENTDIGIFSILGQYFSINGHSLTDEFMKKANGSYVKVNFNKNSYSDLTNYEKVLVAIQALKTMAMFEDNDLRDMISKQRNKIRAGDFLAGTFLGSGAYDGLEDIDNYNNIIFGDNVALPGEATIANQQIDFVFKTLMMRAINSEAYQLGTTLSGFYNNATRYIGCK